MVCRQVDLLGSDHLQYRTILIRYNEFSDVIANLLSEVCHDVITGEDLTSALPMSRMVYVQTSHQVDSGEVGLKGYSLMSGSLIPMLGQIDNSRYLPVTVAMKMPRIEPMNSAHNVSDGWARKSSDIYIQATSLYVNNKNGTSPIYSIVMGWLWCRLSFSLLRTSIMCIRGARSSSGHPVRLPLSVDLITHEPQVSPHN